MRTTEELEARIMDLETRNRDLSDQLLKKAHVIANDGEKITRMQSIGSRFARAMRARGLDEYFVEEWERITGEKVKW